MRMGGYSPAEENDETIVVVGPATLALFGRGGLSLVEELGRVPRWRDRRYIRRRLLWGVLVVLVTVGPLLVTLWQH